MKTFLLFLMLFSAAILLLPMTALDLSAPKTESSSAAIVIRQEESLPPPAQETRPVMETVKTVHWDEPDCFSVLDRSRNEIIEVPVLDYLYGAVAAEMPPTFHPEALKAQAVAAHTYALYCHCHPSEELGGADFSADPENWQGFIRREQMLERYGQQGEEYWDRITQAVDEVFSLVLFYQEEPVLAAYHAISAGNTEYASNVWEQSLPYLVPAASAGDTLAAEYESIVRFSVEEMRQKLSASFHTVSLSDDPASWFQILSRSPSGYVLSVQVCDCTVTGQQLRQALGLRSTHFSVTPLPDGFSFSVLGYGHGVGLSQNGADYLARQGSDFQQILLHYYTGVDLFSVR